MDEGYSTRLRTDRVDISRLHLFRRQCRHFRHQMGMIRKMGMCQGVYFPMPQKCHKIDHTGSLVS